MTMRAKPIAAHRLSDVDHLPDWRSRLHWPIATARVRERGDRAAQDLLGQASTLKGTFEGDLLLCAAGWLINTYLALYEAAMLAQAEAEGTVELAGGPPELGALRSDAADVEVLQDYHGGRGVFEIAPLKWARLRAIARAASWSSWHRLPLTLLGSEATAISHNALLRDWAGRSRRRVGFAHGQEILLRARRAANGLKSPADAGAIADGVISRWLRSVPELREPFARRLRRIYAHRLRPVLERIALDMAALRECRELPTRVWSGTTSAYVSRVICREVRRRGDEVTSFDHGGVTAISQLPSSTALGELSCTAKFVVGTESWAELLRASDAPALARVVNDPAIAHAAGDPTFRRACVGRSPNGARRLRVLYVGHPFRGFRQFSVADPPDTIYWDFQLRVVDALKKLPVDLVCKPHPEGILVGQRNPIEAVAATSYKRFEEHLEDTDIFVFDAPTSTTFGEALCTDRPVVLLNRSYYPINATLDPMVRARCRVVAVQRDVGERLHFNEEELSEALFDRRQAVDPTYFRRLFAGVSA